MPLDKAYDPSKYEADIYHLWEKSGAFTPEGNAALRAGKGSVEPFSIIMPPPNANGNLHAGHAMYLVEDVLARYARMQGRPTLWLPGADHAGIETQVVYERVLAAEGKSRFDLGREPFYDAALAFTKQNMGNVTTQLRSLGFSVDWSKFQFTLDADILTTVYETFRRMHADGLIYRGARIVNWCPHCRSSFSDIELKYREQLDPLYYIKYGPFVIATVRPETKFGDTAIAVNPKDDRYNKLIGTTIQAEDLLGPVKFQVIGDDFVAPEFGTGVVKVTPAHDPNDWEMGQRHHLEVKQVIGTDGLLTSLAGKYAGMTVADARAATAHDLQERGLMDHVDMNYSHSVAFHDRCGTLIEPLVTDQWWLKVDKLKKPAIAAIQSDEIQFYPTRFKKQAIDWLENLHDWNISRQNWFGIHIPIYYNATTDTSLPEYIVATDEAEAIKTYGPGGYEAETDVFDTWFSSGQWPYATLMATGDFDQFYPTSVMATARDILYLWVTRMIMFGIYRTGQVPFKDVYLWGTVNDAAGKKMSKSKGNVINPLEMTSKYGTDALRLALTIGVTPGTGGSLSVEKIEGYRNFCNKLWNVARFIIEKLPENYSPTAPEPKSLADKWILTKLAGATKQITKDIEGYRFSEAGQAVYSLLWNDFADWYIEASKAETNIDVLAHCLETILKLAHPIAPFVTEAIWQQMAWQKQNLIVSAWPETGKSYPADAKTFQTIIDLVSAIRIQSIALGLAKPKLVHSSKELIGENADIIQGLAKLGSLEYSEKGKGLAINYAGPNAWLDIEKSSIDDYKSRLQSELAEKTAYLEKLDKQLANDRLPDHIREQTMARKAEASLIATKLAEQIASVG